MDWQGQRLPSQAIPWQAYDAAAVARAHRELGLTAAYLPYVPATEEAKLREIREAFGEADLLPAELGYWENIQDLDPATRQANRDALRRYLESAEAMGAACAVTVTGAATYGTVNDNVNAESFTAAYFDEAVRFAQELIDAVQPRHTVFCYEPFAFTCLDTIEACARMVEAVDRPQFGIHMDLSNFVLAPRDLLRYDALAEEAGRLIGPHAPSAHIKDLKLLGPATHIQIDECAAGEGQLDLGAYLRMLDGLGREIPLFVEHLPDEASYRVADAGVRRAAAAAGIRLYGE